MRHLLILGFALAVLTPICSAQGSQMPRTKRSYADRTKSAKSGVVLPKTSNSSSNEANLRRLEQQSTKVAASPRAKRTPGTAGLVKSQEKRTPPIRVSGSGAKGAGMTNQGKNPYKGRLRQKGSGH